VNELIIAIATGCYIGRLPKAPGTWGSAAAFVPWFFIRGFSLPIYLAIVAALFIVGFFAAGSAEKLMDQPDPGCIVIDEIVGMLVALILVPDHPAAWLLAFILFRVFDILKPFPVSWLDRHIHGGLGIMLDDVMAGVYALICLQIIWVLCS
jgi:phosphatidylglycerophosphatase A